MFVVVIILGLLDLPISDSTYGRSEHEEDEASTTPPFQLLQRNSDDSYCSEALFYDQSVSLFTVFCFGDPECALNITKAGQINPNEQNDPCTNQFDSDFLRCQCIYCPARCQIGDGLRLSLIHI